MGDGQTPAPPQPHRALPHSGSAHLPSSPLEIMAGSGGAMGTPPPLRCVVLTGHAKTSTRQLFSSVELMVWPTCVQTPLASLVPLPTELSFATQTAGASGDLFIFFFLLDEILWLNTL